MQPLHESDTNYTFIYIIPRNKSKAVPVYAMKACRGAEVHLHSFLLSVLDAGNWSTSRSGRFTFGKEPRYSLGRPKSP
jgi:hypothetical protein